MVLRSWQRQLDADEARSTPPATIRMTRDWLAGVVEAVLDGRGADVGIEIDPALVSLDADSVIRAISAVVVKEIGRPLSTLEQSRIDIEVMAARNTRRKAIEDAAARPEIDGIDLIELGVALLTGAIGDYTRAELETRKLLIAAMILEVERRTGREVSGAESATIDFAASLARTQLYNAREQAARETAIALHDPLFRTRRAS